MGVIFNPRPIPVKSDLIWFTSFREEDLNVIFYQNMPNLHNRYKLAERAPLSIQRWLLLLKIDFFFNFPLLL
jgi:hypothetical protein